MRVDEHRALRHPAGRVFCARVRKEGTTYGKASVYLGVRHRGTPRQSLRPDLRCVLDDILAHDPNAHVACETFTTTGIVTVMGEITTKHYTDIPSIVRRTVERIGYTDPPTASTTAPAR